MFKCHWDLFEITEHSAIIMSPHAGVKVRVESLRLSLKDDTPKLPSRRLTHCMHKATSYLHRVQLPSLTSHKKPSSLLLVGEMVEAWQKIRTVCDIEWQYEHLANS